MSEILWCADNDDGTYRNPVLYCDYSDPDAICVNGTYYLTASTFNYVPGLPILTSRDLVNWKLRNYAVKNIPEARYAAPQHAQGIWAPAIRFQNGRFYIYYGMPDEGIYMVSTENPLGDWDTPVLVKPGKGLIDPCPSGMTTGALTSSTGTPRAESGSRVGWGFSRFRPTAERRSATTTCSTTARRSIRRLKARRCTNATAGTTSLRPLAALRRGGRCACAVGVFSARMRPKSYSNRAAARRTARIRARGSRRRRGSIGSCTSRAVGCTGA